MELESKIGFMQGRLIKSIDNTIQCFPKNCWKDEFPIVAESSQELKTQVMKKWPKLFNKI